MLYRQGIIIVNPRSSTNVVKAMKQVVCPADSIESDWISRYAKVPEVCQAMRKIEGDVFYEYLINVKFEDLVGKKVHFTRQVGNKTCKWRNCSRGSLGRWPSILHHSELSAFSQRSWLFRFESQRLCGGGEVVGGQGSHNALAVDSYGTRYENTDGSQ